MGRRKTLAEINEYLKIHLPNVHFQAGQSYLNSKSPLKFECSHHGGFTTSWNQVQSGSHCPECGQERLKDKVSNRRTPLSSVLKKIDEVHSGTIIIVNPDKYDKQHSRLTFECNLGHQWETRVYGVIQGKGCPKCAGKNITTAEFIQTLNNVHSGKLSLLPDQEYKSRKSKLSFKCGVPEHPVFKAAPSNVIFNKSGCPECKIDTLKNHFAFTTEEVYALIQEKYDNQIIPLPNQVYENQNTKWEFKCLEPSHSNWITKIGHVLNSEYKYGCRECFGETKFVNRKQVEDEIQRVFNGRIELLKLNSLSFKKSTICDFHCHIHNSHFQSSLNNILNSKGCPQCSQESRSEKRRTDTNTLVSQVYEIHRDLVTIVNPNEYINTETKIHFKCHKKRHGVFSSAPHSILSGAGCPVCRMSRGERKILFWLRDNEVDYEYQWRVNKHVGNGQFIFDFNLTRENVVIEYDGRQHFEIVEAWGGKKALAKTIENDRLKDEYAEINGLTMLRIKYTEFENMETILKDFLIA